MAVDRASAVLPAWARDGAVYQIYPRSFQDTDGDGVGDLPGILAHLDALQELGVTTLWLSPVHPSPQADFGYDVADYVGVDPLFGTMDDLDALIAGVHERGMRLILDGVFNHSSDQHPWFQESRSSRESPKRDWYIWRDAPNNWQSTFGGPAWTRDEGTGQYYLHSFLPQQPDLNWRNPEVVDAVLDVLRFWFERGIDGFRLDVYNCYLKHPQLADNPPHDSLLRRLGGMAYGYLAHEHLHDRDQPDLADALRRMREVADGYGALLVGETMDEAFRYDRARDGTGTDRLHQVFHFGLLHSDWRADRLVDAIRDWIDQQPEGSWPTWVLSNHDFPRHPTRWGGGDERAKAIAALVLTLPGTPYLYYGEELGMPETPLRRRDIVDPPGKRFWPVFKGRDGARTPMPWSDARHGGFTTCTPWLPRGEPSRHVAAQKDDPHSVWSVYRQLLALRQEAPFQEPLTHLEARDALVVWTLGDDVVGLMNATEARLVPSLPDLLTGDESLRFSTVADPQPGHLAPHEARFLVRS